MHNQDYNFKGPNDLERKLYNLSNRDANVDEVEALLITGEVDVNVRIHSSTALNRACSFMQSQMVKLLLQYGADKDVIDDNGNPITHVMKFGYLKSSIHELIKILLEAGTSPCVPDFKGVTPLHQAANQGDVEMVVKLIPLYGNLNVICKRLFTPLYNAAIQGHAEVVRTLLEAKVNPNLPLGNYQKPILWYVQRNQMYEIAQILENYGAKIDIVLSPACIKFGSSKILDLSKSQFISYVPPVDKDGMTPLHHAVKNGNISRVEELIPLYTNLDLKDKKSATPLYYAATNGSRYLVKTLLAAGAKPDIPTVNGKTALWHAVDKDKVGILKFFVQSEIASKTEEVSEPNKLDVAYGTTELVHLSLHIQGEESHNLRSSDDTIH